MMKASIGRLRRFALHKVDGKDKGGFLPTPQMDELAQAAEDMQDMRDCYDRLLSAAAATANSAYEFSESLGEMGSCLEKIAPHNDEESGRIFLMLGRVQFELQKLVDKYRTQLFKTITHPSESLLNELRTVEDMKRQCDEKRDVYKYMMAHVKEKGRSKGGKGELQLQTAQNEFQDEATLCIFRLKSLKQGQSRSLLTQVARHHTAQMHLFRDGLKSLEAVEQHIRVVAERQHIDCQLSVHGNEMEDTEGESDGENDQYANEDGELSFDYRRSTQRVEVLSASRSSMKMEEGELSFPTSLATEYATVNQDQKDEHRASSGEHRASSHSAPLFMERRFDATEKLRQMHASIARGSNTYVLPVPVDSKSAAASASTKAVSPASSAKPTNHIGHVWHSSPLEQMKGGKDAENINVSTRLPLPSSDGLQFPFHEPSTQKVTRSTFSGPLVSKASSTSTKPVCTETSSGVVSRLPVPQSTSPRVSPNASPPLASSPRRSELHELPRPPPPPPPGNLAPAKQAKSPGASGVGHSAPLTSWTPEIPAGGNRGTNASTVASPLPVPPLIVPRSFSIPSRNQRAMAQHVSKLLESPRGAEKTEDVASPPLTPLSLMNLRSSPSPPLPQVAAAPTGQIRGGS